MAITITNEDLDNLKFPTIDETLQYRKDADEEYKKELLIKAQKILTALEEKIKTSKDGVIHFTSNTYEYDSNLHVILQQLFKSRGYVNFDIKGFDFSAAKGYNYISITLRL